MLNNELLRYASKIPSLYSLLSYRLLTACYSRMKLLSLAFVNASVESSFGHYMLMKFNENTAVILQPANNCPVMDVTSPAARCNEPPSRQCRSNRRCRKHRKSIRPISSITKFMLIISHLKFSLDNTLLGPAVIYGTRKRDYLCVSRSI